MRWGRKALLACAAIPTIGMFVNAAWLPEKNAYSQEQALILLFALLALGISRKSIDRAVVFFFSAALIPVLIAMARFPGDGQMVWAAAPFVSTLAVAVLTMNKNAVIVYAIIALVADCIIGVIYNDAGLAGALIILTGFMAGAFVVQCQRLKDALTRLGIIERGLEGYVGGNK